jgi:hypothetical protein
MMTNVHDAEKLSNRRDLRSAVRHLGAGLWSGLITGALIGGIGGRLAMLILRLTSDPALHGLETDDGFTIGEVTSESLFLILFATAIGTAGGIFYIVIRNWIPSRHRELAMGLLGAAVGGAVVIDPDGIDFVVLDPLWLAVAMFVALPALYGVAMSLLCERLLIWAKSGDATNDWVVLPLMLLPALIGGPFGVALLVVLGVGWAINRKLPVANLWRSPAVTWLGRTTLVAIGTIATTVLIKDVTAIL